MGELSYVILAGERQMGNKGLKGLIRRSALLFGILLLGLAAACGGDSDGGSGSGSSFGTSDLVPQRANIVGSVAVNQSLDALDMDQLHRVLAGRDGET